MNISTTTKMNNSFVRRQEIIDRRTNTKRVFAVIKNGNKTKSIYLRTEKI